MKLVVQRVKKASVEVGGGVVGRIGAGLFVLVGVKKGDQLKNAEILARKILKLRVMADEKGKMNLSVGDVNGELLVVSQFTLYADTSAGNRPSFIKAEDPQKAKQIYEFFVEKLKENGLKVATGSFGKYMDISCAIDGPVTIIITA